MPHDWMMGLAGGGLIGLATVVLMAVAGRVAGVSGIVGGLLEPVRGDVVWRALFVVGMVAGGLVAHVTLGGGIGETPASGWVLIIAGLLVGTGTMLGSGCTSGHGVCGLARLSPRSMVAVGVFMLVAMVTVWGVRHAGF